MGPFGKLEQELLIPFIADADARDRNALLPRLFGKFEARVLVIPGLSVRE